MTDPLLQPTTSRIGGGSKARFVALGVAGILAAVVWIGFSGRPAPPPPIVAVASPTPSRVPSTAVATGTPLPSVTPRPTSSGSPDPNAAADFYLINGQAGQTSFSTELREVSPGYLAGQYWMTDPPEGELLAFEITPPRTAERSLGDTLGTWLVNMDELASNHRAGIVGHREFVAPRPTRVDAPLPVRRGFDLNVSVRLAFNEVAAIDFEIYVDGPQLRRPIGNDGLAGCRPFGTCSVSR